MANNMKSFPGLADDLNQQINFRLRNSIPKKSFHVWLINVTNYNGDLREPDYTLYQLLNKE